VKPIENNKLLMLLEIITVIVKQRKGCFKFSLVQLTWEWKPLLKTGEWSQDID